MPEKTAQQLVENKERSAWTGNRRAFLGGALGLAAAGGSMLLGRSRVDASVPTSLIVPPDAASWTRATPGAILLGNNPYTNRDIIQQAITAIESIPSVCKGRLALTEGHIETRGPVTVSKSNVVLEGLGGWAWVSDAATKWNHESNDAAIILDPGNADYRMGGIIIRGIAFAGAGKDSGLSNNSAVHARRNVNGSIIEECSANCFGGDAWKFVQDLPGAQGTSLFVNRFIRTWAENNGGIAYHINASYPGGHAEEPTFWDAYAAGSLAGIRLVNAPRAYILGCRLNDNNGHVVHATNSPWMVLTNTEFRYWGGAYWNPPPGHIYDGILVEGGYEDIICNNRIYCAGAYPNARYGVHIASGDRILVQGNTFSNERNTPTWLAPWYVAPGQNLNGRIDGNIP